MTYSLKIKLLCEFIGTFCIVFFGTGAILFDHTVLKIGTISICFAFGLAVSFGVLCFVKVSGAHFNPAVSFVMYIKGNMTVSELCTYVAAQLAGGIAASLILRQIFGNVENLGATLPSAGVSQAFLAEVVLTFVLLMVILSSNFDNKTSYVISALLIGFSVTADAFIGGAISGASMNPARSLAPAIVSGQLKDLWIYIIAPIMGAVSAYGVYYVICAKAYLSMNITSMEIMNGE